jgi:hypothetical protein
MFLPSEVSVHMKSKVFSISCLCKRLAVDINSDGWRLGWFVNATVFGSTAKTAVSSANVAVVVSGEDGRLEV